MAKAIGPNEIAQLQALVQQLVTDKGAADQATQASNDADAEAATAAQNAAQAKLVEQTADAVVTTDLQNLQSFVASLTTT